MRERASGPRLIDGARALLFEKLLADDGSGVERVQRPEALSDAVSASLGALFSVRAPLDARGVPASRRTILDYGVAALEDFATATVDDRRRYAAELREAVLAFEPRLEDPLIDVIPSESRSRAASALIRGDLIFDRVREAFEVSLDLAGGADA